MSENVFLKNKHKNPYKILAKIARTTVAYKILQYRLSLFKSDFILDYSDHFIIVLKEMPGVIILRLEKVKGKLSHYEAYLLSEGENTYLDCFYIDEKFPNGKPELTLVKND